MMLENFDECYQLDKQGIEKGKNSPKGSLLGVGCEMQPRAPP
jgi:hypothetical protein